MKKHVVFLTIFLLLVAFSSIVAADEYQWIDRVQFVGGLTLNTYAYSYTIDNQVMYAPGAEDFQSGWGGYLGTEYWPHQRLGMGFGLDMASASVGTVENINGYTIHVNQGFTLISPYTEVLYQLNPYIKLHGGPIYGYYSYDLNMSYLSSHEHLEIENGYGLGFLTGVRANYPVFDNLTLIGDLSYRGLKTKVAEYYDPDYDTMMPVDNAYLSFSGFRFNLGVSYHF